MVVVLSTSGSLFILDTSPRSRSFNSRTNAGHSSHGDCPGAVTPGSSTNCNVFSDLYPVSHGYSLPHTDRGSNSNALSDGDSISYGYASPNLHAISHGYSQTHVHALPNSDTHGHSFADLYTNVDA